MTNALQAAFVLHRRPFSDSGFLMEVFTLGHGRQPLLARGARGSRARFGQLQPFQPLWLSWRGRGEIGTLSHAEPRGPTLRLVAERLYCGMYLNELLMRMTPRGEPFERLFGIYEEATEALQGQAPVEPVLRGFELELLEELGYGMLLTHTADDDGIEPDAWYLYDASGGPQPVEAGTPRAVRGMTLLAMARRDFSDPEIRRDSLRLMRRVIDHYLDYKTLKSRELFPRKH